MNYIIIIDPNTRGASALDEDNGFLANYTTYEKAKADAEEFTKRTSNTYAIYGLCTDDRNHII